MTTPVYLEVGDKRVFAAAADWPGWCRSGKSEDEALAALAAAAPRYAAVTSLAGITFPKRVAADLEVVELLPGSATTSFGAPGAVASGDADPLTAKEAQRQAALVSASWKCLEDVAAHAPAELRKGPRGGGRDRDRIVQHVLGAEAAYAGKLGLRFKEPALGDDEAVAALRGALLEVLGRPSADSPATAKGWPPRYAARRIAWHALDHAWEIEDRSNPV